MLFARPQCACVFVHVFVSLFVCAVVVFSSKRVVFVVTRTLKEGRRGEEEQEEEEEEGERIDKEIFELL